MLLSLLATALAFDALTARLARVRISRGGRRSVSLRALLAALLLALVGASSLYFLPLYFGWPLPPEVALRRARRLDPWGSDE